MIWNVFSNKNKETPINEDNKLESNKQYPVGFKTYGFRTGKVEEWMSIIFYEGNPRTVEIKGKLSLNDIAHLECYHKEIIAYVHNAIEVIDIPDIQLIDPFKTFIENLKIQLNVSSLHDVNFTLTKYIDWYNTYGDFIKHVEEHDKTYINNIMVLLKLKKEEK